MSIYSEEKRRLEGKPQLKFARCPKCEKSLIVNTVKKDSPNKGREFLSCKECNLFEWQDMPVCLGCGLRQYEAASKKEGKNYGRVFRSCPNHCNFKWI